MDASTRNEVASKLQSAGNIPLHIEESDNATFNKADLTRFLPEKNKISQRDIALFTRELATITGAGLALDHALETLESLAEKPAMKKMIGRINQRIKGGSNFSSALLLPGVRLGGL